MTSLIERRRRIGAKLAGGSLLLLAGASGTAAAHGGGTGGMMGGSWGGTGGWGGLGGFGMLGGWMVVVPLLLLGLTIALVVAFGNRDDAEPTDSAMEALRRRYARGELTGEEYGARQRTLEDPSNR